MNFREDGEGYRITFRADDGELAWGDTVMMHTAPRVSDGLVSGTGLDNAIGVLLLLLSAHFLSRYAPDAFAGRRVIFAFTDQEEGPPIGLFGQGAARLAHALPPAATSASSMSMGTMSTKRPSTGLAWARLTLSSRATGRGSVAPLDYQALAESLA